jgi:hypothetical protein
MIEYPYMKLRMRYHLARIVNRLNVEHRTFNIERRILMTLRFIEFKTSQPQIATIRSALSSQPTGSLRQAQGLNLSKAAESNFEE